MVTSKVRHPLRIGYIWQYPQGDLSKLCATTLHVKAVVRGFEKLGHQVRIIAFKDGQPSWSDDFNTWHTIETVVWSTPLRIFESIVRRIQSQLVLPYFNLFDSYHFSDACLIAAADCDILYERFWILASGGMITSRRLKIPIVYEVNGYHVGEFQEQGIKLSRAQWVIIDFITRRMFINAGQVVAVSPTLKERIVEKLHHRVKNISVIENGADVELFSNPNPDEVQVIRSKFGINSGSAIIFVGTFKPWHGIEFLIDVFNRLAVSNPNAKLILVGDGPLRPEIEKQVASLNLQNRVILTGLVTHHDVPAFLGAADIAVLNVRVSEASSSQSPLKLFEYMAAGKAIVAPKNNNISKILKDRETGLLVSPSNIEELKSALEILLEDDQLRLRLGQAARLQALEQHSWDRTVTRLDKIFNQILKID
jgi:glycosyltransferase involved in cell wall biosynthesis